MSSAIGVNYFAAAALAGNRIQNNATGVVASVDNSYWRVRLRGRVRA